MLHPLDLIALAIFLIAWVAYEPLLKVAARGSLINTDMTIIRLAWMKNMARRENRFMDGQLLGHVLNSASFFASSNLILIAATAGALFSGEKAFASASSLLVIKTSSPLLFEGQIALVLASLARGLLAFIWSIRQINYCLAALGAVPDMVEANFASAYGDATARLLEPSPVGLQCRRARLLFRPGRCRVAVRALVLHCGNAGGGGIVGLATEAVSCRPCHRRYSSPVRID
jgi:uncharacterized membrane protein